MWPENSWKIGKFIQQKANNVLFELKIKNDLLMSVGFLFLDNLLFW